MGIPWEEWHTLKFRVKQEVGARLAPELSQMRRDMMNPADEMRMCLEGQARAIRMIAFHVETYQKQLDAGQLSHTIPTAGIVEWTEVLSWWQEQQVRVLTYAPTGHEVTSEHPMV